MDNKIFFKHSAPKYNAIKEKLKDAATDSQTGSDYASPYNTVPNAKKFRPCPEPEFFHFLMLSDVPSHKFQL